MVDNLLQGAVAVGLPGFARVRSNRSGGCNVSNSVRPIVRRVLSLSAGLTSVLLICCGDTKPSNDQVVTTSRQSGNANADSEDRRAPGAPDPKCLDLKIGAMGALDPTHPLSSVGFKIGLPSWCELQALIADGADRYVRDGRLRKLQAIQLLASDQGKALKAWGLLEEVSELADRERWATLHAYYSELSPIAEELEAVTEEVEAMVSAIRRRYATRLQESTRRWKRRFLSIELRPHMALDEFNRVIWPLLEMH